MQRKNVVVLVVSREVLDGSVVDRNAAFMASRARDLGCRVRAIQIVDRVENEMVAAIRGALEQKPDFLLVTGGLGPASDDNTRACAAKAAGLPLREDPKALEFVRASYRRLFAKGAVEDAEVDSERRRMALLPAGAECFENPIGAGPAARLQVGPTQMFLLPGIPAEMQRLFLMHVVPVLDDGVPRELESRGPQGSLLGED